MKLEQLKRGNEIQSRLRHIEETKKRWEDERIANLADYLGILQMPDPMPAPISAFKRACMDALATEEAMLRAEFDSL